MDEASTEWDIYYQKEELTTRLKNILQDYPPGIGIFKEFLQNADDAQAQDFSLLYDYGSYSNDNLFNEQLAEWQGPALYVFNSSVFSDDDFASIISVGQSVKRDDNAKIGKYGLGFNCAYHLTDVVSFISRTSLIMFDPHALYLPNRLPGVKIDFLKEGEDGRTFREKYPGSAAPFQFDLPFQCNLESEFHGTLFRFPLRTSAQASKSLISSHCPTHQELLGILHDFCFASPEMMLFLRYIERISLFVRDSSGSIKRLFHVGISNMCDELVHRRNAITRYVSEFKIQPHDQVQDNESKKVDSWQSWLDTAVENGNSDEELGNEGDGEKTNEITDTEDYSKESCTWNWSVSYFLDLCLEWEKHTIDEIHFGGHCNSFQSRWVIHARSIGSAIAPDWWSLIHHVNQPPWAAIAAPISPLITPFQGRAFCFLPLPVITGLPVHINAPFALSSNRRDLQTETDTVGDASVRARWNLLLLQNAVPATYAHTLCLLPHFVLSLPPFHCKFDPNVSIENQTNSTDCDDGPEMLISNGDMAHSASLAFASLWPGMSKSNYPFNRIPFDVLQLVWHLQIPVVLVPFEVHLTQKQHKRVLKVTQRVSRILEPLLIEANQTHTSKVESKSQAQDVVVDSVLQKYLELTHMTYQRTVLPMVTLQEVFFPSPYFLSVCAQHCLDILLSCKVVIANFPLWFVHKAKRSNIPLKFTTASMIASALKQCTLQIDQTCASAFLFYILQGDEDSCTPISQLLIGEGSQQKDLESIKLKSASSNSETLDKIRKRFELLLDLPLLPLANGEIALFRSRTAAEEEFFLCSLDVFRIFSSHKHFVANIPCTELLFHPICEQVLNVSPFSAKSIAKLLYIILPPIWQGKKCVPLENGAPLLPRIFYGSSESVVSSIPKEKVGKSHRVPGKKKRNAQMGSNIHAITNSHDTDEWSQLFGLEFDIVLEKISSLWKVISEKDAISASVCESLENWPLVPIKTCLGDPLQRNAHSVRTNRPYHYVVSISVAKQLVLPNTSSGDSFVNLLERLGCAVCIENEITKTIAKSILCRKDKPFTALQVLQFQKAPDWWTESDVNRLGDLVLSWMLGINASERSSITALVRSLPLYQSTTGEFFSFAAVKTTLSLNDVLQKNISKDDSTQKNNHEESKLKEKIEEYPTHKPSKGVKAHSAKQFTDQVKKSREKQRRRKGKRSEIEEEPMIKEESASTQSSFLQNEEITHDTGIDHKSDASCTAIFCDEGWDRLMTDWVTRENLQFRILSTQGPNQHLLRVLQYEYYSAIRFIGVTLIHVLAFAPRDLCIKVLKTAGSAHVTNSQSPWKNTAPPWCASLVEELRIRPIVVLDSGNRVRCCNVIDSTDVSISLLMRKAESIGFDLFQAISDTSTKTGAPKIASKSQREYGEPENSLHLLPQSYNNPNVLIAMRKCGVKSLHDFETFQMIAKEISIRNDIDMAHILIEFLSMNHKQLKWTNSEFQRLRQIAYLPSFDFQQSCPIPYFERHDNCEMILVSANDSVCLWKDVYLAWKISFILSPEVENIPVILRDQLGIQAGITTEQSTEQLIRMVKGMELSDPTKWDTLLHNRCEEAIAKVVNRIEECILKSKSNKAIVLHRLTIPFVLMPDGSFEHPKKLYFDLDSDLGPNVRAVPNYMRPYLTLMKLLGSPDIAENSPVVQVPPLRSPNTMKWCEMLESAINQPDMADVRFILWSSAQEFTIDSGEATKSDEPEIFYAHRLVLSFGSDYFLRSFTSGMNGSYFESHTQERELRHSNESKLQDEWKGITIELPNWVDSCSFLCFLHYIYRGTPLFDGCVLNHENSCSPYDSPSSWSVSPKSVSCVLSLLRLADLYMLYHLKHVCEGYLSSPDIIGVFNVCELLTHAVGCNATQLARMCAHNIVIQWEAVKLTENWQQLSEEIKEWLSKLSL